MDTDIKKKMSKKLKEIAPLITYTDKVELQDTLKISIPTTTRYLRGTVTNIETALKIADFFKDRVRERIGLYRNVA